MIMDTNTKATNFNEYGGDLFDYVAQGFYTGTLKSVSFDRSLIGSVSTGLTIKTDTSASGYNNVIASATYNFTSHIYFNVIVQELNGNDTANDINYAIGDNFLAMPALYVDSNVYSYIGPVVNFTLAQPTPKITILNPINGYSTTATKLQVNFTVNQSTSWIGYSLDDQANKTVTGNFSLTSLSIGSHALVVYANNTNGKMGESTILNFSIDTSPTNTTTTTTGTNTTVTSTSTSGTSSSARSSNSSSEKNTISKFTPGFSMIVLVLSICTMLLYKRKKK